MESPIEALNTIHKYFIDTKKSLCVVESCTGGLLSYWLTHLPDSSKYFKGALVAYQTELKINHLEMSAEKIKKEGLVTKDCALSMAQSVRKLLKADYAVAVTGVAGPSKGFLGEAVGKVAFSVSSEFINKSSIKQFKCLERKDIRHQATFFALDFLISGFKY